MKYLITIAFVWLAFLTYQSQDVYRFGATTYNTGTNGKLTVAPRFSTSTSAVLDFQGLLYTDKTFSFPNYTGAVPVSTTNSTTSTSTLPYGVDIASGCFAIGSVCISGGSGAPAGSDREIQFNNSGAFGSDSDLLFDTASFGAKLTVGDSATTSIYAWAYQTAGQNYPEIFGQNSDGDAYFDLYAGTTSRGGAAFDIYNDVGEIYVSLQSATTSLLLEAWSATKGSCIILKDADGSGHTYLTVNNGVLLASTVDCQ